MKEKLKKITNSGFKDWNLSQVPDLTGRNIFITGGNAGLGLETSKILIEKNANILISSRSIEKAENAVTEIQKHGKAKVDFVQLDLSELKSVEQCSKDVKSKMPNIDIIINNAGIMMTPQKNTKSGHELQLATNHIGHFYLNSLLFDSLNKETGRIVVVSSIAHKYGSINFDDLMLKNNYSPIRAYSQSKLANLLYAFELDRKLKKANSKITCIACHPGYSNTNLQSTGPTGASKFIMKFLNKIMAQHANSGAIPTVLAAVGKEAKPGAYYGPQGMSEMKGRVSDAKVAKKALDTEVSKKLWEKTEELISNKFTIN